MILCKFNVNKVRSVPTIHKNVRHASGKYTYTKHTSTSTYNIFGSFCSIVLLLCLSSPHTHTDYLVILKIEQNENKKEEDEEEKWKKTNRITSMHTCDGDATEGNENEKWNDDGKKEDEDEKEKWFALCVTHMNGVLSMWISFYCYVLQIEVRWYAGGWMWSATMSWSTNADCVCVWRLFRIIFTKSKCTAHYSIAPLWRHHMENPFGRVAPLLFVACRVLCYRTFDPMRFHFIDNSFRPSENGWFSLSLSLSLCRSLSRSLIHLII